MPNDFLQLADKSVLILGVANRKSVAFHVGRVLTEAGVAFGQVGTFADHDRLTLRTPENGRLLDASLDTLRAAWQAPLDW